MQNDVFVGETKLERIEGVEILGWYETWKETEMK